MSIFLIDINDCPPVIQNIQDVTDLLEHSPVDTIVTNVIATDADRDGNCEIKLTISYYYIFFNFRKS